MDRPSLVLHKTRKLTVDTFESDELLYLRFTGALDEDFAGKELAEKVTARMVVLHLAEIERISSFGIREWLEFVQALERRVDEVVLVECAQRIVDQLNMVANFTGHGRVFSFYAPYRCDECDHEQRVILQIDRDWEVIKSMRPPELPCASCGELQHFDEDPITYFSYMVNQGPFELPKEIAALLTSPAQYRPSVLELARRMEVDKLVEGEFTYIRLSGDLNSGFPRGKLADGLEGQVIVDMSDMGRLDPAGAAEWRTFLQMLTPAVTSFSIKGMPSLYLEKLGNASSLGQRAQVLDFYLSYTCMRCHITQSYDIDVAEHFAALRAGQMPEMECRECKGQTRDTASPELRAQARTLPGPQLGPQTREFVARASARRPERRVTDPGIRPVVRRRSQRGLWFALIAALLVAGGAITFALTRGGSTTQVVAGDPMGELLGASADKRPDWVTVDTELAGECKTSETLAVTCVGVSSLDADQEVAKGQARDVAFESALRSVGLLVDDVDWSSEIGAVYGRVRQAKVAEFSNEQLRDPSSLQYRRAKDALLRGRRDVVEALSSISSSDVDTENPADLYWERYLATGSSEERYLVFVRAELPSQSVTSMIDAYAQSEEVLGAKLMTGFPGLAWLHPDFVGGVVVVELDESSYLVDAGLARGHIITAIQGRPIKDVKAFVQVLDYQIKSVLEGGGDIRLTVLKGEGETTELKIPVDEFGS